MRLRAWTACVAILLATAAGGAVYAVQSGVVPASVAAWWAPTGPSHRTDRFQPTVAFGERFAIPSRDTNASVAFYDRNGWALNFTGIPVAFAPEPPRNDQILNDAQIASIKSTLRLTPDQDRYWPPVETALRDVIASSHRSRKGTQIDQNSPGFQRLQSAAITLISQLREDQRRELRKLAHVAGLETLAAQF